MKSSLAAVLLVLVVVKQAAAMCDDWIDDGDPKRCKRILITHILTICGDFEAMTNVNPVENLTTCCCIFGCSDEFLRGHLCPQVPAKKEPKEVELKEPELKEAEQ